MTGVEGAFCAMLEAEILRESEPAATAVAGVTRACRQPRMQRLPARQVESTEQDFHPRVVRYGALRAIVPNKRCQVGSLAPQCEWCASGQCRCHEWLHLWVRALTLALTAWATPARAGLPFRCHASRAAANKWAFGTLALWRAEPSGQECPANMCEVLQRALSTG